MFGTYNFSMIKFADFEISQFNNQQVSFLTAQNSELFI